MKYLILGGGPSGLSFANRLLEKGEDSFLVLEAEKTAGGLCRSEEVDGAPLDIGGGHFLDVRRPRVTDYLFRFMPRSEWDYYERDSRISIYGKDINHPFEANIWQLDIDHQIRCLKAIAAAGCNVGKEKPQDFVEWIFWKLGDVIAQDYMLPYNKKMFGEELSQLGTYWLEKLPDVSFEDTLRSCLQGKAYGNQPGHAQFFYPKKHGYGELWNRMAAALGDRMEYQKRVVAIDFEQKCVKTEDGGTYQADAIITTIPWLEFSEITAMPEEIRASIAELKYSSVQIKYYHEMLDTKAQWIYYPDPKLSYHRILVRHNFCPDSRGYWTETNTDRLWMEEKDQRYQYINRYAYPLNTIKKPVIMRRLLDWSRVQGVYGLGRWGEHQHYNSDLAVELGIQLADELMGRS